MSTLVLSLPVAKLSPPVQPAVLSRARLFRHIDRSRRGSCLWIAAPAGAGKTTLVASYLETKRLPSVWYRLDEGDRDLASVFHYLARAFDRLSPRRRHPLPPLTPFHQQALPTFARRFFERAGERVRKPLVLVFDNYQDLPADAALHDVLPIGIAALPRFVSVVIVSRDAPPPSFASLEVQRGLTRIAPDELTLTLREQSQLVSLHFPGATRRHIRELKRCASLAHGWTAGAVLLLEQARTGAVTDAPDVVRESPTLFSYVAKEIVARLPEDCQSFLMTTCVLPEMTPAMAETLSGWSAAPEFLARLYRTRHFTERIQRADTWYRFHPLFRAVLIELAKSVRSETALQVLRRRAAKLFIDKGLIDEGVGLLVESRAWADVAQEIAATAPTLVEQGRYDTLARWIQCVPALERDQHPWLCYWLASARLPFNPIESAALFRQALERSRTTGDRIGAIAAWGGAAAATFIQLGDLSELDPLLANCPFGVPEDLAGMPLSLAARTADAMTACLLWRTPGDRRLAQWVAFIEPLRRRPELLQQFLPVPTWETYFLWKGDIATARHGFEAAKAMMKRHWDHPTIKGMYCGSEALLAFHEGDHAGCRQVVEDFLESSRREGIHAWDLALLGPATYNELFHGHLAEAEAALKLVEPPPHLRCSAAAQHYHFLLAWLRLQQNDFAAAQRAHQTPFSCNSTVSGPWGEAGDLTVRSYSARGLGDRATAETCHARLAAIAEVVDSDPLRFAASFVGASLAFDTGRSQAGLSLLRTGLSIGQRRNLMGFIGWHAPSVASLCAIALQEGIEVEFVTRLLRTRWLPAPPEAEWLDAWPRPIKIRTLGEFSIHVDDRPVHLGRKAPHRQFDVLKLLIALGGREVSQRTMMDRLWPDSDGDSAKEALDKTLQRLRKLLRHQGAIKGAGGTLSLNRDLCWVDAFAFESVADHLARPATQAGPGALDARTLATTLYRGPFLCGDPDAPWAARLRQRLDRKRRRVSLSSPPADLSPAVSP